MGGDYTAKSKRRGEDERFGDNQRRNQGEAVVKVGGKKQASTSTSRTVFLQYFPYTIDLVAPLKVREALGTLSRV